MTWKPFGHYLREAWDNWREARELRGSMARFLAGRMFAHTRHGNQVMDASLDKEFPVAKLAALLIRNSMEHGTYDELRFRAATCTTDGGMEYRKNGIPVTDTVKIPPALLTAHLWTCVEILAELSGDPVIEENEGIITETWETYVPIAGQPVELAIIRTQPIALRVEASASSVQAVSMIDHPSGHTHACDMHEAAMRTSATLRVLIGPRSDAS